PTWSTKLSYGWIRKGQDEVIETTGDRTRLNVIGAMVIEAHDAINSESVVRFLLEAQKGALPVRAKLHLVLDGLLVISQKCDKSAQSRASLPAPYDPNLNPIERLWRVMSECARGNICLSSRVEFITAINESFNVTQPKVAGSLLSRITDDFQILKPVSSS
ncbi:transposase, partial [Vibrio vulnificus]|nr:transposase [Vibrio vulnificus]MCU8173004.1 transposase [Vibrio vulnificus]